MRRKRTEGDGARISPRTARKREGLPTRLQTSKARRRRTRKKTRRKKRTKILSHDCLSRKKKTQMSSRRTGMGTCAIHGTQRRRSRARRCVRRLAQLRLSRSDPQRVPPAHEAGAVLQQEGGEAVHAAPLNPLGPRLKAFDNEINQGLAEILRGAQPALGTKLLHFLRKSFPSVGSPIAPRCVPARLLRSVLV